MVSTVIFMCTRLRSGRKEGVLNFLMATRLLVNARKYNMQNTWRKEGPIMTLESSELNTKNEYVATDSQIRELNPLQARLMADCKLQRKYNWFTLRSLCYQINTSSVGIEVEA